MTEYPTLPTLSPELLTIIFKFIESERALARISLVCRLFCSIATPFLYSSFRQGHVNLHFTHRRVVKFFRTILSRPDLAQYVQQAVIFFHYNEDEHHHEADTKEIEEAVNERIDALCSSLFKNDSSARDEWKQYRQDHDSQDILLLLLCSLPNLSTVLLLGEFELTNIESLLYCAAEIMNNADSQIASLPFSQLRSVRLVPRNPLNRQLSTNVLHAFLTLPNLRNCEISGVNFDAGPQWSNDPGDPWHFEWNPKSIPVERLSFQRSAIDGRNIANLMSACTHLKEFRFTYEYQPLLSADEDGFTPQQLIQALSVHRDTLEILHIDYGDDWPKRAWTGKSHEELRISDGLQGFSRLRKLSVTFSTFFGVDVQSQSADCSRHRHASRRSVRKLQLKELRFSLNDTLPPSLEELVLIGCDARVVGPLDSLDAEDLSLIGYGSDDVRIVAPLQDLALARQSGEVQHLSNVYCIFKDARAAQDSIARIEMPGIEFKYGFESVRNVWDSFSDLFDDPMLEHPHFARLNTKWNQHNFGSSNRLFVPPFDFVEHSRLFSLNPARVNNAKMPIPTEITLT